MFTVIAFKSTNNAYTGQTGYGCTKVFINSFPHDKILDQTNLKAFADDKLNVTKLIISVFDKVENIVEKGEIACTSNFSFSHNVFKRLLSQTRQKVSLCGNGFNKAKLIYRLIVRIVTIVIL